MKLFEKREGVLAWVRHYSTWKESVQKKAEKRHAVKNPGEFEPGPLQGFSPHGASRSLPGNFLSNKLFASTLTWLEYGASIILIDL